MAAIHFAQDLSISTSFTWISAYAAEALHALGHEVTVQRGKITASVEPQTRELLRRLQTEPSSQAAHVKWTHFWAPYMRQPLNGRVNLEIVALNHALARPTGAASDPWMQAVRDSTAQKLAISQFTRTTLLQNGVDPDRIDVWNLGYRNGRRARKYFYGKTRREVSEKLLRATNDHRQGLPLTSERTTVGKPLSPDGHQTTTAEGCVPWAAQTYESARGESRSGASDERRCTAYDGGRIEPFRDIRSRIGG